MKKLRIIFYSAGLCLLVSWSATVRAQNNVPQHDKSWITQSNQYTKELIDLDKKYSPEYGSSQGLAEYDKEIGIPTLANELAQRKDQEALLLKYQAALQTEKNTAVKQDLNILIGRIKLNFKIQDFERHRKVPFLNAAMSVYEGMQTLLDDQVAPERHAAAVIRLQKYAGLTAGYRPLVDILKERVLQQMKGATMIYPSRQEMESTLARNSSIINGIAGLFKKYKVSGWEPAYAAIKKQLLAYDEWTKKNVLSQSRKDFRMTPEEYALQFEQYGLDIAPEKLNAMAHQAFTDIQNEMKPIAAQIAKQRNWPSADYRDVVRNLKKEQVHGDSIIPLYERHLKDIEEIIRKQQLVTLPTRPAIIRLASEAETAQSPAPHMVPPPFLNNTGQRGVFVLPLNMPPVPGAKKVDQYDDFTFDAASWTIIAHEARPGHELQFDKMVEEGVSLARSLYAFNSTNAEGWGLYSEYIVKPYMPLEGQLISLDYRLLRAARAFLDSEVQSGKITQEHVKKVLMEDVVQSSAMAQQELERYTVKAPGQANSYFYGYTRMLELRRDTEKALGSKFSALRFHDFILSQGLLPPALIREAVLNEFVPAEQKL